VRVGLEFFFSNLKCRLSRSISPILKRKEQGQQRENGVPEGVKRFRATIITFNDPQNCSLYVRVFI
jgi:hypothetical protein